MDQHSSSRYGVRPPPQYPKRGSAASNPTSQADKDYDSQDRTLYRTVPKKIESGPRPAPTKTDWAISDPSKNVTVSAETKARWELLRALAGVKKSEEPPTPKPEASVKDPAEILGPHPHEIVAAQVLQASTVPHTKEPASGPATAGITRRNASHGRRPQPPGTAAQPQTQASVGSHRLRPLMLPRMVNRTNSGRRTGSNGNVPIIRPSGTPEPHHDGSSGLSSAWQQDASRSNREQKSFLPEIQAPKPLQPATQILSGLTSGFLAAAQVPSAVPRPFQVLSPPAPSAPSNNQAPEATKKEIHDTQIQLGQHLQDRSELPKIKLRPGINLARPASNERIVLHAKPGGLLLDSSGTEPVTPISITDKSPEELLMLLASGDPGVVAFIYTDEGIEWLLSMFLYGSVLLAKLWVDENLLSEEARALLE